MNTYWRKMKGLSRGIASKTAVNTLLKKKYPGTISLILDYLSILSTIVLKVALAYLIFKTSNLVQMTVIKNTGATIETTKMT